MTMTRTNLISQVSAPATKTVIDGYDTAGYFSDAATEYQAVRNGVAISDQGHYSRFRISGSDALDYLNNLNLPDLARLPIGRAMTSLLLDDEGGVVCDVYILSFGSSYMVLAEGKNSEAVEQYLNSNVGDYDVQLHDASEEVGLVGLDGPFAWELLKDLLGVKILGLRYLEMLENQKIGSTNVHIVRAGKTGEYGYLFLTSADQTASLWNTLTTAGSKYNIQPIGAHTLDLCRLENRFPNVRLEGSYIDNPFELNCRVLFDHEKDDHKGRQALEAVMEAGQKRRLIGFKVNDSKHVPAAGDAVVIDGQTIGVVANSQFSLGLDAPIGLAIIDAEFAYVGIAYSVNSDGQTVDIVTVSAPFISNRSMTIRPQEDSYFN